MCLYIHIPEASNYAKYMNKMSNRFKVQTTGRLTIQSLTLSLTRMAENCRQSVKWFTIYQLWVMTVHDHNTDSNLQSSTLISLHSLAYDILLHPYHHTLNLGYLQPDSLNPDGIVYSSSDLVISFSITLGKVICVEVTLS